MDGNFALTSQIYLVGGKYEQNHHDTKDTEHLQLLINY